jgi:hypothetical protein
MESTEIIANLWTYFVKHSSRVARLETLERLFVEA